jgi:hypothetical protein
VGEGVKTSPDDDRWGGFIIGVEDEKLAVYETPVDYLKGFDATPK